MAFALVLQPFTSIGISSAAAASLVVTPSSHPSIVGATTVFSSVNASAYENVVLSFNYDVNNLEAGDVLTYGWRDATGVSTELGQIAGQTNPGGLDNPAERGNSTANLPSATRSVYFSNSGTTTDEVSVSNILVNGTFIPDTMRPTVSVVSPATGELNPTQYSLEAADNRELDQVTANLYRANVLIRGCSARGLSVSSYTLTCSVPSTVTTGEYEIRYSAVDKAGNRSQTQRFYFEVDKTAPTTFINNPNDGQSVRRTLLISAGATDDNLEESVISISGPGGYLQESMYTDGRSEHEYSWNTLGLTDGQYSISFTATDAAGNVSDDREVIVNVDNTKGTTIVDPDQSEGIYTQDFSLNATAEDDESGIVQTVANIYRQGESSVLKPCNNQIHDRTNDPVSFICDVDVDSLEDGDYLIKLNAKDAAGNITNTVSWQFTVDTTGPILNVEQPEGPGDTFDPTKDFEVRGTAFDTSGVRRVVLVIRENGQAEFREVTRVIDSNGKWSIIVSANTLLDGASYVFRISAFDRAGNRSTERVRNVMAVTPTEEVEQPGEQPQTPSNGGSSQSGTNTTSPLLARSAAVSGSGLQTEFIAAVNQGTPSQDDGEEVLGTTTTTPEDRDSDNEQDRDEETDAALAWYWWLAGFFGLITLGLATAAGVRRYR